MKRTIGIILIVLGLGLAVVAFNRHEEDNTIIDFGKVEIKTKDKSPSESAALYYVLAGICLVGGGVLVAGKKLSG